MYHNLEDFHRIMADGFADVDCAECGMDYRLEPDGEVDCEECGTLVQSPLLAEGLI